MLKSLPAVPFCIMKKLLYIHDTNYQYVIDENGYGKANIDGHYIEFYQNSYGEIETNSIQYEANRHIPTNDQCSIW